MSGTEVNVQIRSLAFGGAGVGEVCEQSDGRSDLLGITAFVPFTAPGEQVEARVVQRKDRYVQTELLGIVEASPARVTASCALFTVCGGCELQHLDYAEQLRLKYEMLLGALRAAKFSSKVLELLEPVVPSSPYRYRRRVNLHVDQGGKIGFYRSATRSVVPTNSCPVADEAIDKVIKGLAGFGEAIKGKISSIALESDAAGVVAVIKSPYDLTRSEVGNITEAAKKYFSSALILAGEKELGGFGRQILELSLISNALSLRVPAGNFSQVNAEMNRQLIARSLQAAGSLHNKRVLDLYAGAGNFSLPFCQAGAKVTAVECDKRLVALGRENAARYSLHKQLEFIEASVEKFLQHAGDISSKYDLLIADPPRSGLGLLSRKLPRTKEMFLISCHLPSFVRDLKALLESDWEVLSIAPFDMFAQTSYLEIFCHLRAR